MAFIYRSGSGYGLNSRRLIFTHQSAITATSALRIAVSLRLTPCVVMGLHLEVLKAVGMGFGLTMSKIKKPPIGYKYPAEALLSVPSGNIFSWFPLEGWGYVIKLFGDY